MKVAVLSESEADEAAIRIFVEGLLACKTEPTPMPPLRSRGVGAVFRDLPMVLRFLHYRTDAEALVVVVDSDKSPVPQKDQDESPEYRQKCRLYQLWRIRDDVQKQLKPWEGRDSLKIALGTAVPQIEAWYLVGRDRRVSETAWIVGMQAGKFPYTKNSLKNSVYGTEEPSIEFEKACATREAQRIVRDGKLDSLKKLFPGGFGGLANDVRRW